MSQQTTDSHHYKKSSADSEELGNRGDAVYQRSAQQAAELDDRNEERNQQQGQFDSHRAKTLAQDSEEQRPGYKKTVTSMSESDDKVHEAHSRGSQQAGQYGGSQQQLGGQQQYGNQQQQIGGQQQQQQYGQQGQYAGSQQGGQQYGSGNDQRQLQQGSGSQQQYGGSQQQYGGNQQQQAGAGGSHIDHHHKKEVNSNASEHHGTGARDEFKKSDMNSMELDDKKVQQGSSLQDEHHLRKAEEAKEDRPGMKKSHAASMEVDDRKTQQ